MAAPRTARWLLVSGVALLIAGFVSFDVGTYAPNVRERQQWATAVVGRTAPRPDGRVDVSVSYVWQGTPYSGTVREAYPPDDGSLLSVLVDPETPTRVWSMTQDTPPGTHKGEMVGLAFVAALGLLGAAGLARLVLGPHPSRWHGQDAWAGLELRDGRLWYGRQLPIVRRPRARFDPDAFVLVDRDGRESAFAWDDHVDGRSCTGTTWHLSGMGPGQKSPVAVWLHQRETTGHWTTRRLAGTRWGDVLWAELPALAAYLAATPAARPGLVDPGRSAALVRDLAARSWRRPSPPGEPLLGDRLDLHVAVSAVLARHVRRFGGRPVRGEPTPPVEELVAEVIARLPAWVRPRVTPELVAQSVRRHLATGRWPFDVLVADDAPPGTSQLIGGERGATEK